MRTGICIRRLLAASGLALALLPGHALAQNALGDGSALDRNLQRGGTGRNTRVRDVGAEIRYQNAIVTGNAPGGLSFRGDTGYTAPEDFRGRLGSNDIFPFIRETALPAAAAANNLPTSSVLTYQNAVPGFIGANRPLVVERSGAGLTGAEIGQLPSAAQVTTQRALRPVIVGAGRTRDGRDVALAASPLLGLRALETPQSPTGATGAAPTTPGVQPGELRGVTTEPGAAPEGSGALEQAVPPGATAPPADTTGARLDRQTWTFTGLETVARGARAPARPPAPGSPEALALQAPTTLAAAEQRSDAYRGVMDRLRLELGARERADSRADQRAGAEAAPDRGPAPGVEADLATRLDRLRRQLTGEPEPETGGGNQQPAAPEPEPAPGGEKGQTRAERPGGAGPDVSPPSVAPAIPGVAPKMAREDRERDREAMRRAGIHDPVSAALDPSTVEALKRSRTTVRDLRTPSVAENLAYAENMAAGQAFLADGRYFDAEERFVRAAGSIPGDTMASVGRIHSQIGAGLYMSASMNLRTLLSVHPELVATRYAPELLPAPKRWGTIREQLRSRAGGEDPGAARAAALLLAYLGYQMGDREATGAGLTALRDTAELDVPSEAAFVELLTQVWKDAPPVSPAAPAPAGETK